MTSYAQQPPLDHYGPWAVVTGGSEGVGAAFARRIAESGVNLVLAARKPEPLEATAAACRDLGVEVRTVSADLTEADGRARVVDAAADAEVGLFIHNAGANSHSRPFLDGDLAGFAKVVDLNITATLELTQHFALPMRERRRGGVVLLGSLSGYHGAVRQSVYGGVKAFLQIFAESLWVELREHDVHVLAMVLGLTRTPAMERAGLRFDLPDFVADDPEDVALDALAHLPHGPVRVAPSVAARAAEAGDMDRAKIVLEAHDRVRRLLGG